MLAIQEAFQQRQAEIIAISFTPPHKVQAYLARYQLPCLVLSDPTLEAYRAFELGRTRWLALLHPKVVWGYLKKMFAGWLPTKPDAEQDVLQLGGDFVLDRERRLLLVHRSVDPTDRPTPAQLLAALPA